MMLVVRMKAARPWETHGMEHRNAVRRGREQIAHGLGARLVVLASSASPKKSCGPIDPKT
jgi:hypothetical protein